MDQGLDIIKMALQHNPPDSPPTNDPQSQGFGGETTSIPLLPRLRGHILFRLPLSSHNPLVLSYPLHSS